MLKLKRKFFSTVNIVYLARILSFLLIILGFSVFSVSVLADDPSNYANPGSNPGSGNPSDSSTPPSAAKPIPQYTISIASPQPEETFQNNTQELTVSVTVTPDLEKEDSVVVYVDGAQSGDPVHGTVVTLPWLERGSHTLQAKVIQPKGKGAESDTITIYQQRTSKLLP